MQQKKRHGRGPFRRFSLDAKIGARGSRRCEETRWLELHHREPFARGGEHTVDGLELRCRPHNQYEANRDYGKAFMDEKRRGAQVRETAVPYLRCA